MNIWISRSFAVSALLLLAACFAPGHVTVARGDVVVAGPEGFCVDQSAMRRGPDGEFVLLAACSALTRDTSQPSPNLKAVLTATVGPPDSGPPVTQNLRALERFVRTPAGRATISQSGQADAVEMLTTRRDNGVLFVRLRDHGEARNAAVRPEYWRALFDLKGRIVTATVFGSEERPFSAESGFGLLRSFVLRLRQVNHAG